MRGRRVEPIWSRGKSIRKSSDRTGRVISKIGVAVVDEQHRYFEWLDFMERVIARPIPLISRAHSADRRDSATGRKSGREKKNSCILSSKSRAPRVDRRVDSWGRKQRANPIRNQVQQRPGDEIRNQPGRGTVEGGGGGGNSFCADATWWNCCASEAAKSGGWQLTWGPSPVSGTRPAPGQRSASDRYDRGGQRPPSAGSGRHRRVGAAGYSCSLPPKANCSVAQRRRRRQVVFSPRQSSRTARASRPDTRFDDSCRVFASTRDVLVFGFRSLLDIFHQARAQNWTAWGAHTSSCIGFEFRSTWHAVWPIQLMLQSN